MPKKNEKTYHLGYLEEVHVEAENLLRKKLLNISGAYYASHTQYWRDAMRYMDLIGDQEAKFNIFMRRTAYFRSKATKQVLIGMGGVVSVGFSPVMAIQAASPTTLAFATKCFGVARTGTISVGQLSTAIAQNIAQAGKIGFQAYTASTGWRMGINAGTQVVYEKEHLRGIDYISVASEAIPFHFASWKGLAGFAVSTSSPIMEWRPFSENENKAFRLVGYNKQLPEVLYDMAAQGGFNSLNHGICNTGKKYLGDVLNDQLANKLLNHVVFPGFQGNFQLMSQFSSRKIKNKLGLDDKTEK